VTVLTATALVADAVAGLVPDHDPRIDEPPFDELVDAVHDAVPAARARGLAYGFPADIVDASLADIDRKLDAYGDDEIRTWLFMLLRFDVVQLGRLQFERELSEHGRGMHIPELGRLVPADVDDAIARADQWFGIGPISTETWMLDPAVQDLTGGNVRSFADRFDIVHTPVEPVAPDGSTHGDRIVCKFVFRAPWESVMALTPAELAERSSMQRFVAERLHEGHHWTETLGVLRRG
jgi:hypothetical protein